MRDMPEPCSVGCPNLLELIPKESGWTARGATAAVAGDGDAEEKRLELRLGLPGGEVGGMNHGDQVLSLGSFSMNNSTYNSEGFSSLGKEKKASHAVRPASGVADKSHSRAAFVPVVGWPPIRSCRKILASSSKPPTLGAGAKEGGAADAAAAASEAESNIKRAAFFVKINMEGVPIGRKIDLHAHGGYEALSLAVEKLFSGLLAAAHRDDQGGTGNQRRVEMGLLDGSGDYTLVYEDSEGDRVLVGDVPWEMFVSTAKRLRVLKTSELAAFSQGERKKRATAG